MSRQGIICRDKKLKSNTGRMLQQISLYWDIMKNKGRIYVGTESSPIATLIIATWKSLLRHCMKKLCHDKVMKVATVKDKVYGPDIETKV